MTVWTDEMIALAAGMKRAGIPAATIAERLGTTVRAVNQKMSRVGARARLNGKAGRRTPVEKRGRFSYTEVPDYSLIDNGDMESS